MKNLKSIYFYCILSLITISILSSCKKNDSGNGAPSITRIRTVFQSSQTSQAVVAFDSTTTQGKIGTTYAIVGNNLSTTKSITINGVAVYFNSALASNTTLQFSLPNTTPYSNSGTSNTLTVVTAYGQVSTPFIIEQPIPGISTVSQLAGNAGDIITITGTTFDGLTGVSFGTTPAKVLTNTPTVITVEVPAGLSAGRISVTTAATKGGGIGTGPIVTSGKSQLSNNVTSEKQTSAIFGFNTAIYEDSFKNGWSDYGWGGGPSTDTKNLKRGTSSRTYSYTGGYDGYVIQPGSGNSVNENTAIKFSIFGGKGTSGKKINLILNYNFNVSVQLTLTEGKWTDYQIPIANWADASNPAPASVDALVFQEFSGNASTFSIDDIGITNIK
ncbi:hypothetical protein [Mucilaginibacter phyllosphaerae]|uniref:IPT/TIG domain-containing protein n=1 Tax=Mucilaginibacter phyllosphaerae TaxID=1812349 RepID=A0A4Y8AGT4_9SPHI|nr:hypothetical protein [Mucilaginibacter phyllosphaerae]MBB3968826.1 hypothetical protein [Mucilaginibacter phyllosphaerae]TEW67542.1 hypothetical protein E2R65_06010 [Mucilaginibacter phyllosphaerae]GGH13660.1 hypothetical protein GCM10007352_21250 [Mucilaginibacter phyllosphaerae]